MEPQVGGGTQDIPEGWEAYADEASGQTYYVNTETRTSQWEMPVAPVSGTSEPLRTQMEQISEEAPVQSEQDPQLQFDVSTQEVAASQVPQPEPEPLLNLDPEPHFDLVLILSYMYCG